MFIMVLEVLENVLSTLHALSHLIFIKLHDINIVAFLLQMGKLRYMWIKQLTQSHGKLWI